MTPPLDDQLLHTPPSPVPQVRALTCDAEMRCALDEREIEFLWAAPGHIYGAHGWRPNNGSKSERTPYPVGNFKMAVRHGGEGNARELVERRKRWLNSITVGRREVDDEENTAIAAGASPQSIPVRLPDIDEVKRRGGHSRPDSPSSSGILSPAHHLLSQHPQTMGNAVGMSPHAGGRTPMPPSPGSPRGRHRIAVSHRVEGGDADEPRNMVPLGH